MIKPKSGDAIKIPYRPLRTSTRKAAKFHAFLFIFGWVASPFWVSTCAYADFASELTEAAYSGDLDLVQELCKQAQVSAGSTALNLNVRVPGRGTPLIEAVHSENLELVNWLVNQGADVNFSDIFGRTPLFMAADRGLRSVVQYLLDKNADVNIDLPDESSILLNALHSGYDDVAEMIMATGKINLAHERSRMHSYYDPNHLVRSLNKLAAKYPNYYKNSSFIHTLSSLAYNGEVENVKKLISEYQSNPGSPPLKLDDYDEDGWTPLNSAIHSGEPELVEMLIDLGASLTFANTGDGGGLPVFIAANSGHVPVLQVLLKHGADINQRRAREPYSVLLKALHMGHDSFADFLMATGKINFLEELKLAEKMGSEKLTDLLIARYGAKSSQPKVKIPPSEEAKTFAQLYILNKEKFETKTKLYEAGANLSQEEVKALQELQTHQEKALSDFAQLKYGINYSSEIRNKEVIRESTTIKGVETLFYYRNPKFYPSKNRPIVIYAHGDTANNRMTRDRNDPIFYYLISQGFVVVAPNFREGTEMEDLYSVSLEVPKALKKVNVDPSQFYLTSISQGSKLSFKMLETIGREHRINPFKGVQLFSTVTEPDFKDQVDHLPKDMSYLIVHGEKDTAAPVAPMRAIYQSMLHRGFDVTGYFSPSGNHHLVDPKLNPKTPENDPLFQDLVEWPVHFTSFFKRAQDRVRASRSGSKKLEQRLYQAALGFTPTPKTQSVDSDLNTLDVSTSLSLKYVSEFNVEKISPEKLSINEQLEHYFNHLHRHEPTLDWDSFYDKLKNDPELRAQIKSALIQEQRYLQDRKVEVVSVQPHAPRYKGSVTNETQMEEKANRVVAYHASNGMVVSLYHLYSVFEAITNFRKVSPNTFRHVELSSWLDGNSQENPLDVLAKLAQDTGASSALNENLRFGKSTLSLNPTLFSGNVPSSSSISLWETSQVGRTPMDLDKVINEFGVKFCLPQERLEKYKALILQPDNLNNGGMFQFLSTGHAFDQISILTEPVGVKLGFPMTLSEYQRLLIENPEELKKKFANQSYVNKLNLNIHNDSNEKERLFSIAQIRMPSAPKYSQKINVNFYPHRQEQFDKFYKQLIQLAMEDAAVATGRCSKSSTELSSCQLPVNTVANLSSLDHILKRINYLSGRENLQIKAHQLVLQGNPAEFAKFIKENRARVAPGLLLEKGQSLEKLIQERYRENPELQEQMMSAFKD